MANAIDSMAGPAAVASAAPTGGDPTAIQAATGTQPAQAAPGTPHGQTAQATQGQPDGVRWEVNADFEQMSADELVAGLAENNPNRAHNEQLVRNATLARNKFSQELARLSQLRQQVEQERQQLQQQAQRPQATSPAEDVFKQQSQVERENLLAEYQRSHPDEASWTVPEFLAWWQQNKLGTTIDSALEQRLKPLEQRMNSIAENSAQAEFGRQYNTLETKYPHAAEPDIREQVMQRIAETGDFNAERAYMSLFYPRYLPGGDLAGQIAAPRPGNASAQAPYVPPATQASEPTPQVFDNAKDMLAAMRRDPMARLLD